MRVLQAICSCLHNSSIFKFQNLWHMRVYTTKDNLYEKRSSIGVQRAYLVAYYFKACGVRYIIRQLEHVVSFPSQFKTIMLHSDCTVKIMFVSKYNPCDIPSSMKLQWKYLIAYIFILRHKGLVHNSKFITCDMVCLIWG